LKAENKSLILKHTLLSTEHAVMKSKYSSHGNESGDPLALCQRELVDWQNRYSAKENEAKMLTTQLNVLTNVIQTQGLNLIPSAPAPVPAPAPAPTHIAPSVNNDEINLNGWDFGGTRLPAWGNTRPAAVNREPAQNHGWGHAPSPAHTNESSHTYSENDPQRMDYVPRYGKQTKGQPKGKGKYKSLHHQGKRGRDPNEVQGREVRQRTQWDTDGMSIAITWSRSAQLRAFMRSLTLENARATLETLKQAHSDFQYVARNTNFENWHEIIDDNFLQLQKTIGMPVNLTTSPHFYYLAAQWPCKNSINMLSLNELSDPNFRALFNARHPNTFNNFLTLEPPAEILQLGESKAHDWKIAKHYLDEQRNKSEAYINRRTCFYETAIVNNDTRPTCTFLSKNAHQQLKRTYHQHKNKDGPFSFTKLFDESFKNFYTNIAQEIENFAARGTPLEYTQHFTVDIQNLYYFNDDCTGVRTRS
jgi:hypothetical protein